MQIFKNSVDGDVFAFEDDVVVTQVGGVYTFKTAAGLPLLPALTTLTPYSPPAPTSAQLLATAQQLQIGILDAACAAAIGGGYSSAALGAAHTYPSTSTDQANMTASVVASLMPSLATGWTTPFWCADSGGNWSMQAHTAAQIQQAGQDGKAMIEAAQIKLVTLSGEVMAAATVAAVQAIGWQ